MSLRTLVLSAALAAAGLAATPDRAAAQFFPTYGLGYNPYLGANSYAYNPYYSYGLTPYGYGAYNYPYTQYQTRYYSSPFFGTGVYSQQYVAPSIYGPGGYQYYFWRTR